MLSLYGSVRLSIQSSIKVKTSVANCSGNRLQMAKSDGTQSDRGMHGIGPI